MGFGEDKNNDVFLTKSLYLKGLRCYKSLYLNKYHPELRDEPPRSIRTRERNNLKVSLLARQLFPEGVEMQRNELSFPDLEERTAKEIEKGADTIYDAAFSHDGLFVRVDILHRSDEGWEIYEVKEAARVKDIYIDDVAVQYFVLRGSLLPVTRVHVVFINREYLLDGRLNVVNLFTIRDVTEKVIKKQLFVAEESVQQKRVLKGPMPDVDIGRHCDDIEDCGFKGYCWHHIPEDSVFSLKGKGIDKLALYRQGIVHLRDVPLESMPCNQRLQAVATLKRRNFINKKGLRDFIDSIWYPACFLDFETFMDPVPPFEDTRPYQSIPFQYSLHYLEGEGAMLEHYEYLAQPATDPRESIAVGLLDAIPDKACVFVYGRSFEVDVLRNLGKWFPGLRFRIEAIIDHIVDLSVPFKRRDVYFWKMRGSTSIKAVLPALVPEISYEGMEISDGGSAMEAYYEMWQSNNLAEIERVRRSLLEYCRLDTLAMVMILEKLKKHAGWQPL